MNEILKLSLYFVFIAMLLGIPSDHCGSIDKDEVRLLLFYGSFDENRDGVLSIDEVIEFYLWCQCQIDYHAHQGYQSPVESFRTRKGDCLDVSLLIAHFLTVFSYQHVFIGNIAVDNKGKEANHACCLVLLSKDIKDRMINYLGYSVHYFNHDNDLCYIIIDPLYGNQRSLSWLK